MNNKEISIENLSTLGKLLPYGSRKHIAEKTGTTIRYVTRVLLGLYAPDMKVIRAAIDYYVEYQTAQRLIAKEVQMALENGR